MPTIDQSAPHDRARERSKRITWGVVTTLLSSGAAAAVGVFSAPITINYLGKEVYGIWVLITSFTVWIQLFDFGLLNGLTNALTEALGRDDYDSARSYTSSAFIIMILISLVSVLPLIYLSSHIPWNVFLNLGSVDREVVFGKGVCIAGITYLVVLPFTLYSRVLTASQKYYVVRIINFISYLLSLLGLIIGVYQKLNTIALLTLVMGLPSLWHVLCWAMCSKKIPWSRFSWSTVNLNALKRVLKSSIPLLILQLLNMIINEFLPVFLAAVATLRFVADYSITWKIHLYISSMLIGVFASYSPAIRDAFERGELSWIKKTLKKLFIVQILLLLGACAPLLLAGDWFVETWIRMPLDRQLGSSGWCVFTLCLIFSVVNATLGGILVALDNIVPQIFLRVLSGVLLFFGLWMAVSNMSIVGIYVIMLMSVLFPIIWTFRSLKGTLNSDFTVP